MTGQTIDVVSGSGRIVNPTSGAPSGPPAAEISVHIGSMRTEWVLDPRPTTEEETPRSLNRYWEITEYTDEQFDAFLEADRLTPELAEQYKDLLED